MNKRSKFYQFAFSISAVCAIAGIAFIFSDFIDYKIVAFLLLFTVSVLAVLFDLFPVLIAATLSALLWDFFFIPPKYTFSIGSTGDAVMLLSYFLVALINGVLTYKIRNMEKEARLKEEKENAIKLYNTLFNSLSHELRTPISTILGATDTLKDNSIKLSENNKLELLQEISAASLRLNHQVENLLNISRLESGYLKLKKDWCDVSELVYSVVNKLQNKNGHKIEVHIPEKFPLLQIDFGIMQQVLFNLINNSLQHTPDNTKIVLTVSHSINVHQEKEAHKNKLIQDLIIIVTDDGPGFPIGELTKVFDKFYRLPNSRPGGTGLGLSIVKGFVEAHGGKIEVRSNITGGAEFIINIPAEASNINELRNE